ncbi:MAG: class I SAM-dependent methyltransferase [Proteobacteria bacterium]|nr:class I SAM-dependent methyltransferase [Pseudomonadota bacterium]
MLSWEKIDAVPGWFGFHSYALWRSLLDYQAGTPGDLFEIGVWKGRSASLLASYVKDSEKLYLCDIELDRPAIDSAFASVGAKPANLVALSCPSSALPGKLDLRAMYQSVRWMHIDGEHTGTAVYAEVELANQIVGPQGLVVIDDFFSPRYPANTTEVLRYMEKNPFHFRLLAVAFNKAYLCRPEALPRHMDFLASGLSDALAGYDCKSTIWKTTGPWDTDAVGITGFVNSAGTIAGPDSNPHYWNMLRDRPVLTFANRLKNAWRELKR